MQPTPPLEHGKYYHIYNRGNNGEDLFRVPDNYLHFLRLYEKHVEPVAETFAWCLLKNHFHLLVKIKEDEEIIPFPPRTSDRVVDHCQDSSSPKTLSTIKNLNSGLSTKKTNNSLKPKKPTPFRQFSHLFNAYAQSFNKAFNRTGCLFETPFQRIMIDSGIYLKNLVIYIHHNPVHHGFINNFKDYPWSSYGAILSLKPTRLHREKVLDWFDDQANFIETHEKHLNETLVQNLIIE